MAFERTEFLFNFEIITILNSVPRTQEQMIRKKQRLMELLREGEPEYHHGSYNFYVTVGRFNYGLIVDNLDDEDYFIKIRKGFEPVAMDSVKGYHKDGLEVWIGDDLISTTVRESGNHVKVLNDFYNTHFG
jgi:CRISPR/Cas system-associated protein Cas5 (RAMP superfamily)